MEKQEPLAQTSEPAIKKQYERIEKALIYSHNIISDIERKIDMIYTTPAEKLPKENKGGKDMITFHDSMTWLADMSEEMFERLRKAKENFDKAI